MTRFALSISALLLALGLAWIVPAHAQDGKPAPTPVPAPAPEPKQEGGRERRHHEEEDTPLSQQMEKLDHAMHFLKRSLRDPGTKDACLAQVANAQAACVAAKLLIPKMAATTPEAERPAFVTDFRKGVASLLIEFTNLELALLNGDKEAALASYKKLEKMEDEGHNNFTDGG